MKYAIKVEGKVDLNKIESKVDGGLKKEDGEAKSAELGAELLRLQELQFAAGKTPILIVLQGRDTAGKDGAIRFLLQFLNAQSTNVASFKVPTPKELAHDFLWRVHQETPGKGQTVIFNRSHYEDVLVVRVHNIVAEKVWRARYEDINHFEDLLVDNGCKIVKFCLHISKDEQEQRLLEREKDPSKAWKLASGDWKEREFWDDYTSAYNDALSECSTDVAPWYVIPSDRKWFRNLAIAEVLVSIMKELEPSWNAALEEISTRAQADLAAYRASKTTI